MKRRLCALIAGALLAVLTGPAFATTSATNDSAAAQQPVDKLPGEQKLGRNQINDGDCLSCHGEKGFAVPLGKDGTPPYRHLDIEPDALKASVHGHYGCLDCHADIEQLPHQDELKTVDCISCHIQQGEGSAPERTAWLSGDGIDIVIQTRQYTHSVHAQQKDAQDNARCSDCHTAHYVYRSDDPRRQPQNTLEG